MITRNEIDYKAAEFELNPADVQRDYIFSWVLAGIYLKSELGKYLVLKGGNCFRKAYFKDTRFSRDLDFAATAHLMEDFIGRELNAVCDFVEETTGVSFEQEKNRVEVKKRVDPSKKVLEARLYFKDFYGRPNKMIISIRLDITQDDRIILPVQERYIIHPYSDQEQCHVQLKCLKLEEMLATKLKCLLQRRHSPDLFDYTVWLMVNHSLDIKKREIVSAFLNMTIFQRSPEVARDLLIDLPFSVIKGLWDRFIVSPKQCRIVFDQAVSVFKKSMFDLFGDAQPGRAALSFFPSQLRNPIMEAAHNQTVLRIGYKGAIRNVEPYSLVYKKRQDGVAQEYFYGWDQTGGIDSEPGIKMFLSPRIESIETTDIPFDPQFSIELKKAGEIPDKSYFGKPFGSSRPRKTTPRIRSKRPFRRLASFNRASGLTYIIQCTVCDKKFRRKKMTSRLNKHKDKYGNQCYGRTGYLVEQRF